MGKLVVDNRTFTMAAVLQRLHRLHAADKAQAPAVPGAPAVLLDGRRRDLVNDGTDDRIMQLKQLYVTLKEGFWGAVGILYSLVNWLYGLLRRRQTWSVLTALGLLSLAFIVICPTWEPPPETAETAPMVTTSTALIPFVPLKPDKVILEPVEGLGREMFINSFQKYVVDCVQKQMHKIYAYSNSLLTIDQIETNIGRMELNVQGAIRVTNQLNRFIPYMYRGDLWNRVLDHTSAIVLGAWSVLFISMLILHIYKGHTGAAIFCIVLFVAPLTWSVSRWCLSRVISPEAMKYINYVLPTPKTLLGIDLVNRVEDSLLPDLAKILDASLMKGFVDSCENGAAAILILKMATTASEIVHGYAQTPKSCDCGESPSNWISILDKELKQLVSEVDSPETPKIPLNYHLDSVYGKHNARCDDAME